MEKKNDVIKFEKVDFEEFAEDMRKYNAKLTFSDERLHEIHKGIQMPRCLTNAAGIDLYPFHAPIDYYFTENTNEDGSMDLHIPTGVKCILKDGYYLMEYVAQYTTPYTLYIKNPNKMQMTNGNNIVYPKYAEEEKSDVIITMHLFEKAFRVEEAESIFYGVIVSEEDLKLINEEIKDSKNTVEQMQSLMNKLKEYR